MVEWLFLAVPWGCLRFVIVVFPDHTHLLFLKTATAMLLIKSYVKTIRKNMISDYSAKEHLTTYTKTT